MYTVSITSQGQISIPADIRKKLGLKGGMKAIVLLEKDRVIIEPVPDLLSLAGSLHKYAKKGMSVDKVLQEEERAWERGAVERYRKSLKSSK